ncbi:hypothetical protein FXO80_19655 [Salmonella enterica]|nr:hypothetical protein [Salmonella enterica]EHS7647042.1 hypothetical protein [Salmonella enterica]
MSLKKLVAEMADQGAFVGYTVPESSLDAPFEETMLADNGIQQIFLQVTGLKSSDPDTAVVVITTTGCADLFGKEMLNCLPVRRDPDENRDLTQEENIIDLGESVILHMIQGMIDRDKAEPNPVTFGLIGLLISITLETDEEGDLKQNGEGGLAFAQGGKMFASLIGRAAINSWGEEA